MFQSGLDGAPRSANSSNSEPEPGEPLSPEAEALLSGEADDPGGPGELPAGVGSALDVIKFSTEKTEKVLIEIFEWLAERFDSEHWKLSDNQVAMLGEPTAQLLGGVWSKLSEKLPDILTQTPGATAFLLACTIVVVPKAAQQVAVSRARRQGKSPAMPRGAGGGPFPVQPIRPADPDAISTVAGNDFMVPGD